MTDASTNDLALLDHILACIERIREYTGSSRSTLLRVRRGVYEA